MERLVGAALASAGRVEVKRLVGRAQVDLTGQIGFEAAGGPESATGISAATGVST